MKALRKTAAGLAVAIGMALPLAAVSDSSDLIDTLLQKGILTDEEAASLRSTQQPASRFQRSDVKYEPAEPIDDDDPAIAVRRFTVDSSDGQHRFRIRGRVQFDAARGDFDDDIAFVARQAHEPPEYGTIIRRARLGALGYMYGNWEWQLEVDFSDQEVDFANAYVAYLMPTGRLAIGHFKEPYSLESNTSSRRITFLERGASVDAMRPSRQLGIMYSTLRQNWHGAFGFFGGEGVSINRAVEEGYAFSGRLTVSPWADGGNFLHFGGSASHRQNAFDKEQDIWAPVRMRTREGARAIDLRLIGRDDIEAVEDFNRFVLEAAWGIGSFSLQAEYNRVDFNLDETAKLIAHGTDSNPSNSLTMDGFSIQASHFLTGEHRNYRPSNGTFGRVTPQRNFDPASGNWGAFEIAARYATVDASEHSRIGRGQEMDHYTLGLNWYPNPDLVVKLNLMQFDAKRDDVESEGRVVAARLQYEF
ncbi:OprO/OprP family phosphate-selective porin [Alcanivorax quisquiliarum]|uniref:Porin n=1 Tax=Alcanivorax quisquiliarum TaxID=2933565 RepID=A0ABT0EA32_9GAMM|nr:porin [Alcanivorax quisquiliarum]